MPTMYEEGQPSAPICFVGESPSYVEERKGRPLVGPAGEVFNDCLQQAGIIRYNSYILNTWEFQTTKDFKTGDIYERLSSNSRGRLLWTTKRGFTDIGLELAGNTLRRIKNCKANIIVPMGNVATELCLDRRSISKWRGSILQGNERIGGRKILPTFHPAVTLHGAYTWRYIIMADLEKARNESKYSDLRLPNRNIIINPTFKDVIDYSRDCLSKREIATDIEVINHQLSCYCLCHDPSEVMVVPIGDEYGKALWTTDQEIQILRTYADIMGDPNINKINQNLIGFDVPFLLHQNNIFTQGFLGDTMIAQGIMYPDFRKGLDFICSIRTREPYYKEEGKMYKGMGGDIEQFWRYNGKDGCVALEAWHDLSKEMTEEGYWPTYNMVARLSRPLQYMSERGMKVDHSRLEEVHARVSKELEDKQEELRRCAEVPFNVNSPKQCQAYFYGLKGIEPYKNGNGGVTTDDKAMARIYRKHNLPEAKLVQEIRALIKLKSTYLEVAFDKDGRLRCNWNPIGTWTGRLSSSSTVYDTGMNMQNLHPQFKHFLVSDD